MGDEMMTSFRFGLVRVSSWIVPFVAGTATIHEITRIENEWQTQEGRPYRSS